MTAQSREILEIVDGVKARLENYVEADWMRRAAPGKWCRKEILGHLIDSASNNHQRIVRAVIDGKVELPPYAQVEWVRAQGYEAEDGRAVLDFWTAYNRHLAHLIARIPADRLSAQWLAAGKPPMPLEALVVDYIRHMRHHLAQIDPELASGRP